MIELKGKPVADDIKERAFKRVEELRSQGIIPKIATIRVGDDPGDIAYEHGICSRAEEMGIDIKQKVFAGDISQERLLAKIAAYNEDPGYPRRLIFRPLPKQFDDKTICKSSRFPKGRRRHHGRFYGRGVHWQRRGVSALHGRSLHPAGLLWI